MVSFDYLCLVLLQLFLSVSSQTACSAPSNATLCTSVPRTHTGNLRCGERGALKEPDPLDAGCLSPSFATCRDSCILNPHCFTFSYNVTEARGGYCIRYRVSLTTQHFRESSGSTAFFWNRHCFKKSCPDLKCPSDSFQLQVNANSNATSFLGQYVAEDSPTATFTPTIKSATYFHLDSHCNLVINRQRTVANAMNASPRILPGPVYFTNETTIAKDGYTTMKCHFPRNSAQISCTYGNGTGNAFFACQSALSLPEPYPGDATCGSGNGGVKLTAFNFTTHG